MSFGLGENRIQLGSVDESNTPVKGAVDLSVGIGLRILVTKGHGSQTDLGNLKVAPAESVKAHRGLLGLSRGK